MVFKIAVCFLTLAFYLPQFASGAMTCLSCKGAVLPVYCDTVVKCGQHESCFSDTFVTSSGFVRYDLGCRDTLQCTRHSRSSLRKKRSSSTDSLLSVACCRGDLCNAKTKQHAGYSQPRGPICFNCKSQAHYDDCNKITVCSQDEFCGLKRHDEHSALFQTSCERIEACSAAPSVFGRRESINLHRRDAPCSQCCSTDLCNDRCNASAVVSSPCASRPCLGGSCRETGSSYVCDCNAGYAGTNCETVIQSNPCLSNPCMNGVCVNHGSSHACTCHVGYTGLNCDKRQTPPPTVAVPTTPPTSEPTLMCEDKLTDCSSYSTDLCWNKKSVNWDSFYCPKFCNTCKIACEDRDSDCSTFAYNCANREWARFRCAKTCNICKGTSVTSGAGHGDTSAACHDKVVNCSYYLQKYCYQAYMQLNCKKYCNVC